MGNFDFAGYNSALNSWNSNPFGYEKPTASSFYGTGASTGVAPVNPVTAAGAPSWVSQNPFSAPGSTPSSAYNPNPTPTSGAGAFGAVPGQLGLPDPAKNLGAQLPGLSDANAAAVKGITGQLGASLKDYLPNVGAINSAASNDVLSQLHGELPADVVAQIQNNAARFGVSSGMPGSAFQRNAGLRDLGLTSLDLQGRGLAAYSPLASTIASTQLVNPALNAGISNLNSLAGQTSATQTLAPGLATSIAETNAQNAAAPDPTQAASYAKTLFDQYLAATQGRGTKIGGGSGYSGGGPGGGFGALPNFSAATSPSNFLGGNTGYDANGYPISSYAPGPFPGTNGGSYGNAANSPAYTNPYDYSNSGAYSDPYSFDPYLNG